MEGGMGVKELSCSQSPTRQAQDRQVGLENRQQQDPVQAPTPPACPVWGGRSSCRSQCGLSYSPVGQAQDRQVEWERQLQEPDHQPLSQV